MTSPRVAWRGHQGRLAPVVRAHRTLLACASFLLMFSVLWTTLSPGGAPAVARELHLSLLLASSGLALFFTQGIVSRDIYRGTALLWLQKPVSLVRYYLARLLDGLLWSFTGTLALAGLIAGLLLFIHPAAVRPFLQSVPLALLCATLLAITVFAFSALKVRQDIGAALLYLVVSLTLLVLQPGVPMIRVLAFPIDPLVEIGRHLIRGSLEGAGASVVHVGAYLAVAMAIGIAGTRISLRAPFPEDQSR